MWLDAEFGVVSGPDGSLMKWHEKIEENGRIWIPLSGVELRTATRY